MAMCGGVASDELSRGVGYRNAQDSINHRPFELEMDYFIFKYRFIRVALQ